MVCQDILLESLKKSAAYQCNLLYPHCSQNSFLSGFETKPPDYFSQGLILYERQILGHSKLKASVDNTFRINMNELNPFPNDNF